MIAETCAPILFSPSYIDASSNMQVPVSPFDNALAVDQLEVAYNTLVGRKTTHLTGTQPLGKDGAEHPRIVR